MKKLFTTFILILSVFIAKSQHWDSLGSGINGSWPSRAMCVYNGELYVGGDLTIAGGIQVSCIARWNGTTWDSVGSGVTGGTYTNVTSMAVYKGNLYVGGSFAKAGGVPAKNIAMWNGSTWTAVGSGISSRGVNLAVFNNLLIAAGYYDSAGGVLVNGIGAWNGSVWASTGVTSKLELGSNYVAMYPYDSVLFVCGGFDSLNGMPCNSVAQWNGTTWSAMSTGLAYGGYSAYCYTECMYNHNLYVGGDIGSILAGYDFVSWNGAKWDTNVGSLNLNGGEVFCSVVANGKLYIAGSFGPITPSAMIVYNIASWDGTQWDSVGSGLYADTGIRGLCVYNNELYAMGDFRQSGNIGVNRIARWRHLTGINQLTVDNGQCKVYPNPSNGVVNFVIASGEKQSQLEVYNALGERVYVQTLRPMNQVQGGQAQGDNEIDLSTQPNGIYLYRIIAHDGSFVADGKIIIQHYSI